MEHDDTFSEVGHRLGDYSESNLAFICDLGHIFEDSVLLLYLLPDVSFPFESISEEVLRLLLKYFAHLVVQDDCLLIGSSERVK